MVSPFSRTLEQKSDFWSNLLPVFIVLIVMALCGYLYFFDFSQSAIDDKGRINELFDVERNHRDTGIHGVLVATEKSIRLKESSPFEQHSMFYTTAGLEAEPIFLLVGELEYWNMLDGS